MDPFTIALATFGIQKLRGKSTNRALRDAAFFAGGTQLAGMAGLGPFQTFQQAGIRESAAAKGLEGLLGTPRIDREAAIEKLKGEGLKRSDISEKAIENVIKKSGTGFKGMSTTGKLLTGSAILPFLDKEEPVKPIFTEKDYEKAYKEQSEKLEGAFKPVEATLPAMNQIFGSNMFYANKGGLATAIPKYNKGGVNYLPSKTDHDENDVNNYVRAEGYVEDGAGAGDKDEDTMLAQLADGEFVSRADAVLGAGILSGADPKSFKGMRKAGANFFYDQQKKLKRIYDLVNASKPQ
jgi:hypothetical protein